MDTEQIFEVLPQADKGDQAAPGSISTKRSTSISAPGSPRAIESKTQTLRAPCSAAYPRISSRRAEPTKIELSGFGLH